MKLPQKIVSVNLHVETTGL